MKAFLAPTKPSSPENRNSYTLCASSSTFAHCFSSQTEEVACQRSGENMLLYTWPLLLGNFLISPPSSRSLEATTDGPFNLFTGTQGILLHLGVVW